MERGLRNSQLTESVFLTLLLALLPSGKPLLSLDCTTWERGHTPLNLLVLGVVLHGYTLPLVWLALEHDGNGNTAGRMRLVSRLLRMADREFIGQEWFRFLRQRGIRRAIWIKKNALIDELRADAWFRNVQHGMLRCLAESACV